jgi:hypothetical protein
MTCFLLRLMFFLSLSLSLCLCLSLFLFLLSLSLFLFSLSLFSRHLYSPSHSLGARKVSVPSFLLCPGYLSTPPWSGTGGDQSSSSNPHPAGRRLANRLQTCCYNVKDSCIPVKALEQLEVLQLWTRRQDSSKFHCICYRQITTASEEIKHKCRT